MSNDIETRRMTYDGRVVYPVQIWLTKKALAGAESLRKRTGFENCRSRSAVLAKHCERLAK